MNKAIKVTDIKWAFITKVENNITQEFIKSLCLFVGEIIRSDEVGLIVWQHQPIIMIRIPKVDFETMVNYVEIITFHGSMLKEMLSSLNIGNIEHPIICSGFELFCYRPKPDKPYHPKIHPTYIRARERASRVLDAIFVVMIDPEMGAYVSFAQVSNDISRKFFKKLFNQNKIQCDDDVIDDFVKSVDSWLREFYTDKIGEKQYRTKNRYPIAPKPLEGTALYVITSDDDGNLISYHTNV